MDSIWTETSEMPHFDSLKGHIKADVLIIGGGIAGLLTASRLAGQGVKCVLAERERICGGITKNTTAKITVQHGLIYHSLTVRYGPETARMYLDANRWALEEYRRMCREIPCDFEEKDSFVYSVKDRKKLEKELAAMERLGCHGEFADERPLPFSTAGAIRLEKQAQFHPLKFLSAVVKNLEIYENTPVREMEKQKAVTENGSITADKIIAATHFPFLNKHGSYFLKLYQHRSYVIALEGGPDVEGMYVDEDKKGLSFRNAGNLLLLGGGGCRTGKKGGGWCELERQASVWYPQARLHGRWAAQDCMSLDKVPYIGQYSRNTPGFYVASGFNKWGMTSAMAASGLLTDLVLGKENPWAAAFSPSRTMLHPQLAVNGLEAAANLLTISPKRCPHLGCALKWNPMEHSWDCPCHGSRFREDGKLLDNPAQGDLKGR